MNLPNRILLCLFSAPILMAQHTDGTEYTANVGVTFTEGNSNTEQINVGFEARKTTEKAEISVTAFYDYGRSEEEQNGEEIEVTNLDKGKLEAKGNYILSEDLYAYINFTAEQDEISGIDRRVTGGPGLGHYFRREDSLTLSVEGGAVWVYEERDDMEEDYAAVRFAQNLKWELTEGARLRQDVEIVADVSDEDNYFINAKLIAEASLTAVLGLRMEIRDTYNNQPGSGKEQNDITVLSGVTVNW